MSKLLTLLFAFAAWAADSPHPQAATVDTTLQTQAHAEFTHQTACDLFHVSIQVTFLTEATHPGTVSTSNAATIKIVSTPISTALGCYGYTREILAFPIKNPAFTMDRGMNIARLTGSANLEDFSAGGTAFPVTFDITWRGTGPLMPSFHVERQDLGTEIALVTFVGVQRAAVAAGTMRNGSTNYTPLPATIDTKLSRDLLATVTIKKK